MALPVTVSGFKVNNENISCAFKSSAGNYYILGLDGSGTERLRVVMVTDPTVSVSHVGTGTTAGAAIVGAGYYQVGDVIHCIIGWKDGSNFSNFKYQTFDMSSDSFVLDEDTATGVNGLGSAITESLCDIVVRSGGEVVVINHGLFVKSMGTNYQNYYWQRRTGVATCSAQVIVTSGTEIDFRFPRALLGASDAVHFIYANSPNIAQRTLNSSNVLQTASTAVSTGGTNAHPYNTFSYDSSGTTKCIVIYFEANVGAVRFDSGNTPTLSLQEIEASARGTPAFVDTGDSNKLWAGYVSTSDGDLYSERSTDNGATWGTKTLSRASTYTHCYGVAGSIYQRGSNYVAPVLTWDGTTLRYDEITIRAASTAHVGTAAPSIVFALAALARMQLLASAKLPIQFDLAANAEIKPLRLSALLTLQTDLIANARRYTPSSVLEDIVFNLSANALRFTNTSALLAVQTDLIATARRFTPSSVFE